MHKLELSLLSLILGVCTCGPTLSQVADYPQRTIELPQPVNESTVGDYAIAEDVGNIFIRSIRRISSIFTPASSQVAEPADRIELKTYSIAGARWLILEFQNLELDSASTITVTSEEDGQVQTITPQMVREGIQNSVAFNGDTVIVQHRVPVGDEYYPVVVSSIVAGEPPESNVDANDEPHPQSLNEAEAICGGDDNRITSTDNRVGRLMTVGCTAWAIPDGLFLTAGHCVGRKMAVLQYNVPESQDDGTPVMPPSSDQFVINRSSIVFADNGIGDDWAVFSVLPNESGELPHDLYDSFTINNTLLRPLEVTVIGFGLDSDPPGRPPTLMNRDSQTQQRHSGPFVTYAQNDLVIEHRVDTRGGNSGGPIVAVLSGGAENTAIGIHTHGGCDDDPSVNHGTTFLNQNLFSAIQTHN